MPAGKITVTLSGSPALLDRVSAPARCEIEVIGGREHASAPLCVRMSNDAETPAWHQELSMSLGPAVTGGTLRVSLRGPNGVVGATGERSLATVMAEDVDRTQLELLDDEGSPAGTVELVLRLFHGRSALDRRSLDRSWSGMHRGVSAEVPQHAY